MSFVFIFDILLLLNIYFYNEVGRITRLSVGTNALRLIANFIYCKRNLLRFDGDRTRVILILSQNNLDICIINLV